MALLQVQRNGRPSLGHFFMSMIFHVAVGNDTGTFNRVFYPLHPPLLFGLPCEALAALSLLFAAGPYSPNARTS